MQAIFVMVQMGQLISFDKELTATGKGSSVAVCFRLINLRLQILYCQVTLGITLQHYTEKLITDRHKVSDFILS
jgi:phage-related holin